MSTSQQFREPVLTFSDLDVRFRTEFGSVHAVKGVSLDVKPGEVVALVGESGSGKSVTSMTALGLLPSNARTGGRVQVGDNSVRDLDERALRRMRGNDVAMVFQEPMTALNPVLTIGTQLTEALELHGIAFGKAADERAVELLRMVGIPEPERRLKQYPHELSGGQRQRVVIAIAISCDPKVIIADEPTTALDVLVEAQIISILADLRRSFDTSLLFITHNLGIVAEACDRVAVMYAGRIVEQGPVHDVFAAPKHPYTRELLRSTISLRTTGLHYIPGAPPDLVDPPAGCRFHPRCPQAMRVCAERFPRPVHRGDQAVECWLHGPEELVPEGGREPLVTEEVPVADEA